MGVPNSSFIRAAGADAHISSPSIERTVIMKHAMIGSPLDILN